MERMTYTDSDFEEMKNSIAVLQSMVDTLVASQNADVDEEKNDGGSSQRRIVAGNGIHIVDSEEFVEISAEEGSFSQKGFPYGPQWLFGFEVVNVEEGGESAKKFRVYNCDIFTAGLRGRLVVSSSSKPATRTEWSIGTEKWIYIDVDWDEVSWNGSSLSMSSAATKGEVSGVSYPSAPGDGHTERIVIAKIDAAGNVLYDAIHGTYNPYIYDPTMR